MRSRPLGWTGAPVPVIGQGTWNMERDGRTAAVAALRAGLDLGMTHIDTAEAYGSGRVEEIVGEAIEGRRGEVFLASKVSPGQASYEGVLRACEASLRRLRTDHLDLYLLHWPGRHPLEGTMRAFERLTEDGKIRFWGVSNFDVEDLDEALAIVGEGRIACNQVVYHLGERAIEHAVIPWCERHNVAVVGYSPFGSGAFPSPHSAGGRILQDVATTRRAGPHQVAIAFLLRRPSLFSIPKSSDPAHTRENAGAADLELSPDEIIRLDQAFPLGKKPRSLPMI